MTVIDRLENYFKSAGEIRSPVTLSAGQTAVDPQKMIRTHLIILKANSGNKAYMPYYDRLLILRRAVEAKKKESNGHTV